MITDPTALPAASSRRTALLVFLLLAAMLAGCAVPGVMVRPTAISQRFNALDRTALNSERPSEFTLAFLKQRDLTDQWRSAPEALIAKLDASYAEAPSPDILFALMELAHLRAKRVGIPPEEAAPFDLSCALYAYLFLFDPKVSPPPGYLRPDIRQASAFYNRSVSRYLLYARSAGLRFHPGMKLPMATGVLELKEREHGLPISPEGIVRYHLAFEYAVSGLDITYSVPGLGVPLILIRNVPEPGTRPTQERLAAGVSQALAATLFVRIETQPVPKKTAERVFQGRLELYDPMRVNAIEVDGRTVPLETDTTTPLAWMVFNSKPPETIKGLMDPLALKSTQGLYLLQPYEPEKIPVVFVHGLISSPMTWVPMINSLMGDPKLRERYQFWYFSYATGNPVFYSAMVLRDSLESVRNALDPQGENPALNNMLVVGHSMGGLLAKALVQDPGEQLWDSLSRVPHSQAPVSPEVRDMFKKLFFFKPLPYITEAVFLSTPHRGSEMALNSIGRIAKALVKLPVTLLEAGASLVKILKTPSEDGSLMALNTGIDSLSPKNQQLQLMASMPVAVPFHSIIGNEAKAGFPGGTDGVVPYASAHLEGAQSELIVKSGHGTHEHPLAIRRVRDIMLEHAQKAGGRTP